jgi:hypothetical protein
VRIAVDDRLTLNVGMEIGQVTEKMQVQAEAPLLETTSSASSAQSACCRRGS